MPKSKTERAIDMVVTANINPEIGWISPARDRGFIVKDSFYKDGEKWFEISLQTRDETGNVHQEPAEMPVRSLIQEAIEGKIKPINLARSVMLTVSVAHQMLEEEKQKAPA